MYIIHTNDTDLSYRSYIICSCQNSNNLISMRKESSTFDRRGQECERPKQNFLELDCFIDCSRALILCGHRSKTQKWVAVFE